MTDVICITLLNLHVISLMTQRRTDEDGNTTSFVSLKQLKAVDPKATGLAYFDRRNNPVIVLLDEGRIYRPDAGWPEKLYVYEPGLKLKPVKEPEEFTLEDKFAAMEERIVKLENEVESLKKLNGKVDDLKKKTWNKNTSKFKFRQLCRDNDCDDSITYSESAYEKWKQSGGGAFFVPPRDKPSSSHSSFHHGKSDSYHHSYNDHGGYYGHDDYNGYHGCGN